ncbi:MAG: hypothetical protein ACYCQI_00030 [Gammaproteobacteria bacterium]
MLNEPSKIQQLISKALFLAFPIAIFFYSGSAYAIGIDVSTMIQNLGTSIPSLMQLVTAIAYVLGMFFIIKGVFGLKEYGENRAHRGGEHGLKGPVIMILVGAALLYLPSSVQVGLSTFWSEPNPYAYQTDATDDSWAALLNSVYLILQLIGTISFIRGLIILANMGHGGHQQGGFAKALSHMIGGILLINIYQFLQVIFNTLAIGS